MDPIQIPEIKVLHDTGYHLAPGNTEWTAETSPARPPLPDGHVHASIRVHPEGKTYVWATVPAKDELLIEWALAWSVRIWTYIDEPTFRHHGSSVGFRDHEIEVALTSIRIHDDAYYRKGPALEVPLSKLLKRTGNH